MNSKAKKYAIVSGGILMLGLLLLFIATLTVNTKDVFSTNINTLESKVIKTWQGFSYNYISAGNLALFNIGLILVIVGCASFIFSNLWLTKRLSKDQMSRTFGKKINAMYLTSLLIAIGLIVSFIAGGSWDGMMDPSQGTKGLPTTIHKYLAMILFAASLIITFVHVSLLYKITDIKGKVVISIGKEV